MSKQPPPTPTTCTSAVGPCPTVIQIVGRPSTGSLPSTIAPPDHPPPGNKAQEFRPNVYGDLPVSLARNFSLLAWACVLATIAISIASLRTGPSKFQRRRSYAPLSTCPLDLMGSRHRLRPWKLALRTKPCTGLLLLLLLFYFCLTSTVNI